jgi:hypothetical protein
MRVQHVAQVANGRPDATAGDRQGGSRLAGTIERIRWRLWHGQVRRALDLIGETLVMLDATADDRPENSAAAGRRRAIYENSRHMYQGNPISSSTTQRLADVRNRFRRRSLKARCSGYRTVE